MPQGLQALSSSFLLNDFYALQMSLKSVPPYSNTASEYGLRSELYNVIREQMGNIFLALIRIPIKLETLPQI